jgi:hypothetical protein
LSSPPHKFTSNDDVLICHAVFDESVGYRVGHGLFFVDGKEIGKVPCLAICQEKNSQLFTLYYGDQDWNLFGVATNYRSVDAAKNRAERIYPGSLACWVQSQQ